MSKKLVLLRSISMLLSIAVLGTQIIISASADPTAAQDRWAIIEDSNKDRLKVETTDDKVWTTLVQLYQNGSSRWIGGIVESYPNEWGFRFNPNTILVAEITIEAWQTTIRGISQNLGYWLGNMAVVAAKVVGIYPLAVQAAVQTVNTAGTSIQAYIYVENFAASAKTVNVEIKLNGTVIRTVTGITVPAVTALGVSGKYFIDKTTVSLGTSGTLIVTVTSTEGDTASATLSFTSETSIAGDVTNEGDTPLDQVNIFDAILLSTAFGGNPGPSTSATIIGPWKEPNADFNDDNTIDIYDAVLLSVNFPY